MSDGGEQSREPRRWPWALVLAGSAAFVGLVLGTAIGATRVPEGSGLAGPAIALGYGVLGAGVSLAAALVAAWKLPRTALRIVTGVAALAALVLVAGVAWRIADQRAERRAETGADVPLPSPASWRIEASVDDSVSQRAFRDMTVDGSAWRVSWTSVGPEADPCSAPLVASEAADLSQLLARAHAAVSQGSIAGCDLAGRPATHTIDLRQGEAGRRGWTLESDTTCLQHDAFAAELDHRLRRLVIDAVDDARARCDL